MSRTLKARKPAQRARKAAPAKATRVRKAAAATRQTAATGAERIRRWDGAQTDRLNKAHWQGVGQAYMQPINADLWHDLPVLRARCEHEAQNNPFVEGVIETHAVDVVGPEGPTLQIQSKSQRYNRALEDVWREWFDAPDINGVLDGVDMIRMWIRMFWLAGEHVDQIVTDRAAIGPVQMKILNLHPSRLQEQASMAGDPLVVMGIKRTAQGRPLTYYIAQPSSFGVYTIASSKSDPIPAEYIIHEFKVLEPGQARGVPWLASSLQTTADLRDYDVQVLDAARAAADQATYVTQNNPDAPFIPVNEIYEVERRTIRTLPNGCDIKQLAGTQPMPEYVGYRSERQRELGRGVNMPLMTIRLGSEDHNYSSARFDNKVYQRGVACLQSRIHRRVLNRLVMEVAREAELSRAIPPRPKDFTRQSLAWTWQPPATVDFEKELQGYLTALEIGAMDLSEVAARMGTDIETLIARRVRTMEMLIKAELPPAPFWTPGAKVPSAPAAGQDPGQPGAADANTDDTPPKKKAAKDKKTPAKKTAVAAA